MKHFQVPAMEVIFVNAEDVIVASPCVRAYDCASGFACDGYQCDDCGSCVGRYSCDLGFTT